MESEKIPMSKLTLNVSQKDRYKRKWKNEVKGMGTNAQWGQWGISYEYQSPKQS